MGEFEKKSVKKIEEFGLDFEKLEEIVDKLMQQMAPDLQANPDKPAIIGFSMRLSSDGKPLVEEFGNVSKAGLKPVVAKVREPLVDIQLAEKNVFVTVELPGVEKENVKLNIPDEQTLEIIVAGQNSFYKKLSLPVQIKKEQSKAKFKNGILEISLDKKNPAEQKSDEIKIE
jgi:HSP20 family protein